MLTSIHLMWTCNLGASRCAKFELQVEQCNTNKTAVNKTILSSIILHALFTTYFPIK